MSKKVLGSDPFARPDDSKPSTTVNLTIRVGSRHENYGETGMAHLLEHLVFKGTPTHRTPWVEFTRRGLRTNGTTWVDRTNYYASFTASDRMPSTLAFISISIRRTSECSMMGTRGASGSLKRRIEEPCRRSFAYVLA